MKGQKCITNRLKFANRWFSIDVILQELPPVCGHVVANVHDFSTSNEILIQKYTGKRYYIVSLTCGYFPNLVK